jgi:hypothetical protein
MKNLIMITTVVLSLIFVAGCDKETVSPNKMFRLKSITTFQPTFQIVPFQRQLKRMTKMRKCMRLLYPVVLN